jgi:hypothetical protein
MWETWQTVTQMADPFLDTLTSTSFLECKSQHYPGENPTIILVSKRFQSNLPARIIVVKGPV